MSDAEITTGDNSLPMFDDQILNGLVHGKIFHSYLKWGIHCKSIVSVIYTIAIINTI